jgi:arylsulfatase A-like enzyme
MRSKIIFGTVQKIVIAIFFGAIFSANAESLDNNKEIDLSCPDCNVIFLNMDLLRADSVGLRDLLAKNTPNIDKFFKNSIIFRDVSASSGVTAISNTATLMARDGFFTYFMLKNTYVDKPPQMPYKYKKLYSGLPTIAEILKSKGYETININHGYYAGKQMLLNRGFDKYWGTGEVDSTENIPAAAINKTIEYIQEITQSNKKFFLLMRSEDLRGLPYRYPDNRVHIKDPRIKYLRIGKGYFNVVFQLRPDGKLTTEFPSFARADWMSNDQIKEYQKLSKALYAQQLKFVDEELGKIFSTLEGSKLLNKTIVVLYANHGDGLYDNRIPNHGVSYQSCVSVPVFIRHPKVNKPVKISEPVALIDLVPTIYEMLSVSAPEGVDGVGLTKVINGQKYPKEFLFGVDKESQYVRHGKMKFIIWADRTKELYDLDNDPKELNNIAAKHPELVSPLDARLVEHEMNGFDKAMQLILKDMRENIGKNQDKI